MEIINGNDGVLAAGIAVAAMMQLFVCTPETSYVGTNRTHIVLKTYPQENAHLTIHQGASGREKRSMSRLYVGLPPTKLLLRLIERLLAQQIFPVETTFPGQALGSCASIKRTGVARKLLYPEVQVYSSFISVVCGDQKERSSSESIHADA